MKTAPTRALSIPLIAAVTGLVAASVFAATQAPATGQGIFAAAAAKKTEEGFKLLDANRDGAVNRKEWVRVMEISPKLKGNPDAADNIFQNLDKNSDEKLTLEEYRGIVLVQAMAARAQKDGTVPPQVPAPGAAKKASVSTAVAGKPLTQAETEFFEKKIRPVLNDKCYKCHSAEADKVKGGLLVDTREGIRTSGDNGHAVVPGDVKNSLLLKALRYDDPDLQMPPEKNGGKLPAEVIADFEKWIAMGAPDPREAGAKVVGSINLEKGREHWAFKPPQSQPAPAVTDSAWAKTDIDRHILAGLEAKNLKPVGDADKATLLRRVHFDLIGLPPSPEDVQAFLADKDAKAFEKVVDKLLASPQYGERWGRHWLDVARYAESSGKSLNVTYPHAWRYREWVFQAFNEDLPYDQFLKEQLAGDLLPAKNDTDRAKKLIATGYLAIGPKEHNTRDYRQFQLDVADEQIDAISQGMLGLTVACARCHDHKFDPVPQADYYSLAGIFLSTETRFGTPRFVQNNQSTPPITLPEKAEISEGPVLTPPELAVIKRTLAFAKEQRESVLAEAKKNGDSTTFANPRLIGSSIQIAINEKILERYDASGRPLRNGQPYRLAMGVQDKMFPRDTQLLQRGEMEKPQDTVPRGFVQVLAKTPEAAKPKIAKGSGRLELAGWIASAENPLTARVMANRVWVNLFDRGLVPTPDNFGTTGQMPENQALLDYLALSFVESGWSVKKLVKQIVMSRTYQLASDYQAAGYAADPDNALHWRMSKRRLDAEAIRDAMLAVAGKLDLTPPKDDLPVAKSEGGVQILLRPTPPAGGVGGGPFRGRMGAGMGGEVPNQLNQDRTFRSVYLPIVRDQVPDALAVFDFAEASLVVGDRDDTTVPSQALYLMNSATVQKLAEAMAARLAQSKATGNELGKRAFELAYSRPPTANETKAVGEFFTRFYAVENPAKANDVKAADEFPARSAKDADARNAEAKNKLGFAALSAFCQALLGSAEFRYLN
ncbi:MAG: DUF1549 domain-containing protein [Verrucomicrobia bacterium]|nr:DUF1549 domain-containing protein [Verrucomicrobiota bacterium]